MSQKAIYVGTCADPGRGTTGTAWPAAGFSNPYSIEHGAYLFQPDGAEYVDYVDPATDLDFVQ